MGSALKVHPWFFREFASKTWTSAYSVIAELVENSFDEDATKVLVTLLKDGSVIVEDDVGMDEGGFEHFLLVGSPHKLKESLSPRFERPRSGRYGTGRLAFLTAFGRMVVTTRRGDHARGVSIDEGVLERLSGGLAELEELSKPPLDRNGTEVRLMEPRLRIEPSRLHKELRRLAILRYPFFEVYLNEAIDHRSWSFDGAEQLRATQAEGLRIEVALPDVSGEVVVTRRPLPEDEQGLAIIVGSHMVDRRNFDFNVERITGWVRCDKLTTRFADKASLIEDDAYLEFQQRIKTFIRDEVMPQVKGLVEATITREEARVYRQVDSLLADAVHNILEPSEQVAEVWEEREGREVRLHPEESSQELGSLERVERSQELPQPAKDIGVHFAVQVEKSRPVEAGSGGEGVGLQTLMLSPFEEPSGHPQPATVLESQPKMGVTHMMVPKMVVRRTFTLKKVGFRVVPYEDEEDDREAFTEQNVIYINKAHSTYRTEALRGASLLLRHVVRLVSKVIALEKYPEGREAVELQNRLIAEAIRLTQPQHSEQ